LASTKPVAGASTSGVERAAAVLTVFTKAPTSTLGITEIANAVGLSKAVVHRLLNSLRESGLIDVEPSTRRYRLGPMTLALGLTYLANVDLRENARPLLEHLSALTNETATLSLRQGWYRVYIDQVNPLSEVRMTVPIGQPFPLHAGSSSKSILAFLSEAEQNEFFETQPLEPLTSVTFVNPDALRKELARIVRRGYARSAGERQSGAHSIAAPVFDHSGSVAGAVSICGPAERFSVNSEAAVEDLLLGTRDLSRQLGFS
jgi:DNA-binding IclR family transcriptional regulator